MCLVAGQGTKKEEEVGRRLEECLLFWLVLYFVLFIPYSFGHEMA